MTGSAIDLRCGDWREVLAEVGEVDALITDPPYSERTHGGMIVGEMKANYIAPSGGRAYGTRASVIYPSWAPSDVEAFIAAWLPRTRGWFVGITDHILWPAFESALRDAGRYVFQPIPFVEMGKQPRLSGDGPASWTCWIVVARPSHRPFSAWGSLPGGYAPTPDLYGKGANGDRVIKGGKPLWLMRALVRDYTRPGDLVCDPCAGGATTLLAAAIEGRRAIGAELDPVTHAKATRRIARGYTPDLFTSGTGAAVRGTQPTAAAQADLFGAGDVTRASDKPNQR